MVPFCCSQALGTLCWHKLCACLSLPPDWQPPGSNSCPYAQAKGCPTLRAREPPLLPARMCPAWRWGDKHSVKRENSVTQLPPTFLPPYIWFCKQTPPRAHWTSWERNSTWLMSGPLRAGLVLMCKAPLQREVTMVHIPRLDSETLGRGSRKVWTTEKPEAGKNTQQSWDKSPSHPA